MGGRCMNVGILGATGYTGMELVRILSKHPNAKITYLSSKHFESQLISEVYPGLDGFCDLILEGDDFKKAVATCDIIFSTLPHELTFEIGKMVVDAGKRLIDLGSAFRFDDFNVFKNWYGSNDDIEYDKFNKVYGLTELNREKIKNAQIVGNPGCYPTSVILALAPVLKNRVVTDKNIIIDSKSGVSGAGHEPKFSNLYSECNENTKPYNVAKHRHIPEIEQELSKIMQEEVKIVFTPHLVPMTRGILSTIYCNLKSDITLKEVYDLYQEFYKNDYFIKILKPGKYPSTKSVAGSNFCQIGFETDEHTNTLIIMSVIDNLMKGACGQAVQNMNLMFGLPENKGLDIIRIFP
jgi:N-acetyl-gamma-glutamyl-phosphate reductase